VSVDHETIRYGRSGKVLVNAPAQTRVPRTKDQA
jgi:hypothetical protein